MAAEIERATLVTERTERIDREGRRRMRGAKLLLQLGPSTSGEIGFKVRELHTRHKIVFRLLGIASGVQHDAGPRMMQSTRQAETHWPLICAIASIASRIADPPWGRTIVPYD